VRRLAFVLIAVVLTLGACGGSSHPKTSPSRPPSAEAQIKSAFQKFFSSKTPVDDRVSLLQNGTKFKPVVQAFASNPLAKNTSATVDSVTLQGRNSAKVIYAVKVSGASLPIQHGTAVRENGVWKVSDASLCKLIALQGSTPSACKP
jgi:hypothetical protein